MLAGLSSGSSHTACSWEFESWTRTFQLSDQLQEAFVVKPDVLTDVPTFLLLFFNLDVLRVRGKLRKGTGGAECRHARPQHVALAAAVFGALDPRSLQGRRGLARKIRARPGVRGNARGSREPGAVRAGVVLGAETCRRGFLAGHPGCSWPPCTEGLAGCWASPDRPLGGCLLSSALMSPDLETRSLSSLA